MDLLIALLHMMVAVACVKVSSATCRYNVTCPCGKTGKDVTFCSSHSPQSDIICQKWANCKQCHPEIDHCTECPSGYTGHNCLQMSNGDPVQPKNKYRYTRSGSRRRASYFAGESANCPALKNTDLIALRCTDTRSLRTCQGKCLTGYAFRSMGESEIKMTCKDGTWTPTNTFPDCVSNGQCQLALTGHGGGSYNCSMDMDGTRCTVICDGRFQGRFFCYPGKGWDQILPQCVKPKDVATAIDSRPKQCQCPSGGDCDSYGRCLCPAGRTGVNCEEVVCPDPGAVRNSNRVVINGPSGPNPVFVSGHTVIYTCNSGYVLMGSSYISCLSSGIWSSQKPTCSLSTPEPAPVVVTTARTTTTTERVPERSYCLDPGNVANGDRKATPPLAARQRGFLQGSRMTYSCKEGYHLKGVQSMYCMVTGEWSSSKPTCEVIPKSGAGNKKYCRNPGPILNGKALAYPPAESDGRTIHEDDFEYPQGTSLEYECDDGYTLTGSLSINCEKNGFWSAVTPSCIEESYYEFCDNPGRLANGRVVVYAKRGQWHKPTLTDEGFREGTRLQFDCNPDYRLIGLSSTTCGKDGMWSGSFPYCKKDIPNRNDIMYCDNPGSITNGELRVFLSRDQAEGNPAVVDDVEQYPQWTRLQYSCEEGYKLKGMPSITCGINGFWSSRAPTCERECGQSKMRLNGRIAHGELTETAEFPWTVAVAVNHNGVSDIKCGGVLIDRRSVLTAAHCLDTPGSVELYFGKYQRKTADDDKRVVKRTNLTVLIQPNYNNVTYDSDIALIRFTPQIRYTDYIQPICLPTPETTAENIRRGKEGYVTGWGFNEEDRPTDSLSMAYLPVLPGDYCIKAYQRQEKQFPMTSNMYCAGFKEGGQSVCSGDSGSPMVFYDRDMEHYTLEGLISFGVKDGCSMPERYTVVTKVMPYMPWVILIKMTSST